MKILTTLLLGLSLIGSANADESVTVYALPVTKAQVGMLGMRHPYNYNSGMDRGTDLQLLIIQSGKLSKKAK
ncbi:MAG TPA: hypothetical protein PLH57_00715, partial [Oligoflexia bacterium]|nr:hypothetical protein [Oligoflexia bacterium]